ncbi:unnamed protein product [Anisakis simplex]|uniref:BTB domain-containing protein n=1 Tax=Anisakis simplex TaxID=6269 RepID=A0A3P6QX75_ANISI|nr:unnamed protein product [Anisakis simplex]
MSGFSNSLRICSDAGGTNQQVITDNLEVSKTISPFVNNGAGASGSSSINNIGGCRRDRSGAGNSTVIPVGGTLSRPIRKKRPPVYVTDSDFKATVRERVASMYLNDWLADVVFIVGSEEDRERIPAHSYVLSIASRIFSAMFHGGFEKKTEIEIPDVEPIAFKILLKYLYTDEVEIKAEYALCLLYAAKKYFIHYLTRAVVTFLEANLSADNVCLLLSQVTLFEEQELIKRCWELVDANAECVLRSKGFVDIDYQLFEQIISRETLIIHERTVFEASVEWAKAECVRRNLELNAMNIRHMLSDAFYHIRFPVMTINEFANCVVKSELLSCQETNNIFLHFAAEEKPRLQFPVEPRNGLPLQICSRFHTVLQGTNQWRYRGRCDSIQFIVDRRIFVAGYGLYGSSSGQSRYSVRKFVKMELKKGHEVLATMQGPLYSSGFPEPQPLLFNHPVQVGLAMYFIDPDIQYTASVTMEGQLSHFGQEVSEYALCLGYQSLEGMSEVVVEINYHGRRSSMNTASGAGSKQDGDEVVNFFFTPSADSKNGTGVQGGQIPQILFYP